MLNFVSFYFLYPSTFNLLEVAAVDRPELHMWETVRGRPRCAACGHGDPRHLPSNVAIASGLSNKLGA